jgi:SAM-dependent methyltransferase
MATLPSDAAAAYAVLADHYDLLTGHYRHDLWLERLEALALDHGLKGRKLLDVGCGTGKSFLPMVARGYEVTACDLSPEMVLRARAVAPPGVTVLQADMRNLPRIGPFDVVTCLDDALNYVLDAEELLAAFRSFASVLRPGGVLVFDCNTLATYRSSYTSAWVVEDEDAFLCWHGHGLVEDGDVLTASATVEIFTRRSSDLWRRGQSLHHQRHWPGPVVLAALAQGGLSCVAIRGQRVGAVLEDVANEKRHTKTVYVARKGSTVRGLANEGGDA